MSALVLRACGSQCCTARASVKGRFLQTSHWHVMPSPRLSSRSFSRACFAPPHLMAAVHKRHPCGGVPSRGGRLCLDTAGGLRAVHVGRREARWRVRDDVPAGYTLVYLAPMEWYVRYTGLTVVAPLVMAGVVALTDSGSLPPFGPAVLACAGMYALTLCAVLVLTRRYVFRMYHSAARRHYRAVLSGPLMLTSRHVTLAEGSVSALDSASSLAPWKWLLYDSGSGKLILFDTAFRTADDYNRLLGYRRSDEDEEDDGVR